MNPVENKPVENTNPLNLLTVVGNRPQFIKMSTVSQELNRRGYREFIVHTGQHKDDNLSQVFFNELNIPTPDLNLAISGGLHGEMTAQMLQALEQIMIQHKPNGVLIYGDTNSTLAATLAAVKLKIPLAHIEAGPRFYDMDSPEEINRIIADHVSKLRFCPDLISFQNLAKENITEGVYFTGDVMFDAFQHFSKNSDRLSNVFEAYGLQALKDKPFALLTAHRPNNTDTVEALSRVCELLKNAPMPVVFPVHPRTEVALKKHGLLESLKQIPHVHLLPPLGYLEVLQLLNHCQIVLTDSGGLQKEGFFAGKPVVILFFATPWPQIESCGWQKLCWKDNGLDVNQALEDMVNYRPTQERPSFFGDGRAASHIVDALEQQPWWNKSLVDVALKNEKQALLKEVSPVS